MNKTKCNSGKKHNTEEELMQSYLDDIFGSILEEESIDYKEEDKELNAYSFIVEQNDGSLTVFKNIEELNEFLEKIDSEDIASIMEMKNIMVETKTRKVFQAVNN